MIKQSVKKPYTVVVGVALVIILGIVAYMRMTVDLLPDINLPYAIVMTTYGGASPEEVETVVTRPVEQSMATVSNIKNISSISAENSSIVILEFEQTANMDSVTIEMRELLDQIKGYWPDAVSSPLIMKLNPEMLPVMITAIGVDGTSGAGTTEVVREKVLPELESVEGVARVTAYGEVTESVEITLLPEKIDALNEDAKKELDKTFEEAQEAIDDARAQIESGKAALESGSAQAAAGIAQGQAQIAAGDTQITQGLAEVAEKEAELNIQLTTISTQLLAAQMLDESIAQLEEAGASGEELTTQKDTLEETIAQLDTAIAALEDMLANLPGGGGTDPTGGQTDPTGDPTDPAGGGTDPAGGGTDPAGDPTDPAGGGTDPTGTGPTLEEQIAALQEQRAQAQDGLDQLQPMIDQVATAGETLEDLKKQRAAIPMTTEQLAETKAQIEAGLEALAATKKQLQDGAISLNEAKSQIAGTQVTAAATLATGSAQIAVGEAQLNAKEEEFEAGKDSAYAAAAIDSIINQDTLNAMLSAQNFNMPAGYVYEGETQYLIRVGDRFSDITDLEDWVLVDLEDLGLGEIKLSDIAEIAYTDNAAASYAKINGAPGLLLSMEKQTGYSTNDVSSRLLERMEEIEEEDGGIECVTLMDQGIYIKYIVNSVLKNMLMGAILAILILLVFLRDWRPTSIIACAIPFSVLLAVVLMYFSKITLNIISLAGLALGIGMLVDNSIVVIENIYRLRSLGLPIKKASVEGARQVAGAIIASTLTTVCVFVPIVFTNGITRELFVDMGLTIGYSLVASLLVSLTLVPMMASGMLRKMPASDTKVFKRIKRVYEKVLGGALKARWPVLIGALALTVLSALLALSRGMSFMPAMEGTQLTITMTTDEEMGFDETCEVSDQVMERLLEIPDITDIGAMAQGGSGSGSGSILSMMGGNENEVSMYAVLTEKQTMSNHALIKKIEEVTADLPCELEISAEAMDMSALGGSGISVQIKGRDIDRLQELAKETAAILEKDQGIAEVDNGLGDPTGELRIVVDKTKATSHSLTVAQVYQAIAARLAQVSSTGTLYAQDGSYDIYVYDAKNSDLTRDDIKEMTIETTDSEGKKKDVKISDIATFEDVQTLSAIRRSAQSRTLTVSGTIAEDDNVTLVSSRLQKELDKMTIPKGYSVKMVGEDETIMDATRQLGLMLLLAVLFMYLIMVAQFQSLLSPFIVMFTVPLAFTGGFLGLWITGFDVSVIAMIGFIVLSGVIVNNGIVYVDYVNQLTASGMKKREALIEAGKTRMRPIVMTALTTILGLVTLAMGMGMGADSIQPMAIVTIGGLLYGTVLTLIVVPCIYDILVHKKQPTADPDKPDPDEPDLDEPDLNEPDSDAYDPEWADAPKTAAE